MSSNHSSQTAESDSLAIDYLWDYYKSNNTKITKKQAKELAVHGIISVSNLLEQVILDNNKKLKKSNLRGEDYSDHSDAKYMTARARGHGKTKSGKLQTNTAAVLSPASIKNKTGALRVFITHIDDRRNVVNYRMFVLPYPEWQKRMLKGGIDFCFSPKTGDLAPRSQKRWGEFEVKSIKQLSK